LIVDKSLGVEGGKGGNKKGILSTSNGGRKFQKMKEKESDEEPPGPIPIPQEREGVRKGQGGKTVGHRRITKPPGQPLLDGKLEAYGRSSMIARLWKKKMSLTLGAIRR